MEKFKCFKCDKEFDEYRTMSQHISRIHGMTKQETYIHYYHDGVHPTCKCGCGQETFYRPGKEFANDRFAPYIRGHVVRDRGGFQTEEGLKKSAETRRQRFESGEIVQWNKGKSMVETYGEEKAKELIDNIKNDTERAKKISKSLTGKKKSPEHIAKITEDRRKYWGDETHRLEQRFRRCDYFKNYCQVNASELEKRFIDILEDNLIDHQFQFDVNGLNYDFQINGTKILIEVDGDFHHCNPDIHGEPKYEIQHKTIEHDKLKNEIADRMGYSLIRFWENDVNNNLSYVISTLKDAIRDHNPYLECVNIDYNDF